ncbi:MAG: HAMP domain-containing histidine kinase [Butyrivibrio sp.]|nr:HAMP domain-containing histidine kinase [Butyrivibrio sp.]
MKHSIRKQFALIFIGLMAGTVLLCWLINNLFLEEYYIRSKTEVIYEAYETIRQVAGSDTYSSEEFRKELNDVCSVANITVLVMDANSQTRYESVNGGRELEALLLGYIFGYEKYPAKVLEEGNEYVIQRMTSGEDEFLVMYGRLSTGISFIMRTPVESIRESADIANRFLAYVGIVAAVAGGIIIWLVSGKITKPIKKLNSISEQMVHLNFEARYNGKITNEIGMLGENINKLSSTLEQSISGLKTANNELLRDIEKKEETDRMRREFLANVSHELKTPIALIQGYAEGLSEGVNDDPESRSFYCEVIMDEASKMNLMVRKLLTLNQLEFGNDVVSMERFDITALVKNYVQSAGILTKQNGIRVCMEEYPPVYVWGDEFKVEEVFMNYFTNAVNYCGGEKKIVVTLEQKDALVRVGVFNTGEPVPEEALPHLWEKFYKVDKARTREYGGSGVGLSIVKAIMESMNRQYGVENRSDGVLFWFELEAGSTEGEYGEGTGEA